MEELGLVGDLAVVALAALVGGALARFLRLPSILGYLAAGIAIGPHTPGPSGDVAEVGTVADLGVALLLFMLGIRFSLRELWRGGGLAAGGGLSQVGAMIACGVLIGVPVGLGGAGAMVAG